MKTTSLIALAAGLSICFAACKKDKNVVPPPTANTTSKQLSTFFDDNVTANMQHFSVNAATGGMITGSHGTMVYFPGGTLKDGSGNLVSGMVDVALIEIYDRASMVLMNKPTLGILPNGDKSTLVSKGEYYLKITQNGTPVNVNSGVYVYVPVNNISGPNDGMSLFEGVMIDGNFNWDLLEQPTEIGDTTGGISTPSYQILQGSWGWTNVDRFYNDPRPKTVLKAKLPTGFDDKNSEVYLAYDGEPGALASLDRYTDDGFFSEHYGHIPIGLNVHFIAVTLVDGQLNYAIQGATITADHIEYVTAFTPITQADLAVLINALP